MTDAPTNTPQPAGHYETETVIEVVDDGRRRRVLAAVLVLLILLLSAVGFFVWKLARPAGIDTVAADEGFEWIRSIYAWGDKPEELLRAPVDTAITADGTIWTVSNKTTLVGFNPNGTTSKVVPFVRGGGEGQVGSIEGMDADDQGNLYLADFGLNKVHVVSAEGSITGGWGVELPVDIAVDGERVAVAAANGIGVFDLEGNLISQFASRGQAKDQVDIPHGIAWTEDGNLLVSDTHNRRVKVYSADGRVLAVFPKDMEQAVKPGLMSDESMNASEGIVFQLPAGMSRDASGRVVLVDPFEFAVVALNPENGEETQRWGSFGYTDGKFAYPTGIDYDQSRDYYVIADTANNRLQVVRLPGSGGNAVLAGARRLLDGPIWLCAIPLLLILIAIVYGAMRRRRRSRELQEQTPAMPGAPVTE